MASMRNWLHEPANAKGEQVVVVHCKAGKGRSGTVACSYLISEEGWDMEDALKLFTARRMRTGFGAGVSIPSQLRWVGYVDHWTKIGKVYVERPVEVVEVHVWGLRDGVKVGVDGFVDEGRVIKTFHVFKTNERIIVDGAIACDGASDQSSDHTLHLHPSSPASDINTTNTTTTTIPSPPSLSSDPHHHPLGTEPGGQAVIFRPRTRIILPTSDICVDFERRNRATYGWSMVTAVAHVWFNAYFEGLPGTSDSRQPDPLHPSPLNGNPDNRNVDNDNNDNASPTATPAAPPPSNPFGVFHIDWEAMDGIKGSSRKGVRALDHLAVLWRVVPDDAGVVKARVIREPGLGVEVPNCRAADWHQRGEETRVGGNGEGNGKEKLGEQEGEGEKGKELGLRVDSPVARGGSGRAVVGKGREDGSVGGDESGKGLIGGGEGQRGLDGEDDDDEGRGEGDGGEKEDEDDDDEDDDFKGVKGHGPDGDGDRDGDGDGEKGQAG